MVDWPDLLSRHGITYVEGGPNVGRNNIAIACPWCGTGDPGQHLVISLEDKGWMCWRNHAHRGRSAVHLLATLLRCSRAEAARKLGIQYTPLPDDLAQTVNDLSNPPKPEPAKLENPAEFKPLRDLPSARRFLAYLASRGFPQADALKLAEEYGLCYALRGRFHNRILFPVWDGKHLLGWTGRTISEREPRRYLTHGRLHTALLWHNQLRRSRAHILVVCEVPFDSLKLNYLGAPHLIATCCFTSAPSVEQLGLLHELAPRFSRCILMLDYDSVAPTMRTDDQLAAIGFRTCWLPARIKDPGSLDKNALWGLVFQKEMS